MKHGAHGRMYSIRFIDPEVCVVRLVLSGSALIKTLDINF